MDYLLAGILTLGAYLLGSVPTALWVGKYYFAIDIRLHGSKNVGATNTFRVLGKKPGAIVMLIDTFKGWAGTSLALLMPLLMDGPAFDLLYFKLLFGLATVLGHVFPLYAGFKGGKGVAASLGMLIAIHPLGAFICFMVFLAVFFASGIVSLGSVIAAIAFPLVMLIPAIGSQKPLMQLFAVVAGLIVILTHKNNIRRLIKGEEKKILFHKTKS